MIVSIDTSTPNCSVALHDKDKLIASLNLHQSKSSSSMLQVMLEDLLKFAQISWKEVQAIAVAKGPGSYTGLRICTSTAKGLCFALDIPLLSVNTLEAMAHQVHFFQPIGSYLLCPMLDARRMEVYCAIYGQDLQTLSATEAKIIDANSFSDILLNHKIIFFGDGASKCQKVLTHQENAIFLEGVSPNAAYVGTLAYKKFQQQAFEDVAYFEPFYLKDFIGNKKVGE